jgi:hypothetical protein
MKLKRLRNIFIVWLLSKLFVACTTVLAAMLITLVAMMAVVTVATVFAVLLPYKVIAVLVGITALVAMCVVNVIFAGLKRYNLEHPEKFNNFRHGKSQKSPGSQG